MVYKVIHAPLNMFFDTTPSGWILNRFSKDIEKLDNEISDMMFEWTDCVSSYIVLIYVCALVSVWVLLIMPIVGLAMYFIIRIYVRSYRELV